MNLAHMARARLRDRHQENLKKKLNILIAEQGVARNDESAETQRADDESKDMDIDQEPSTSELAANDEEIQSG